MSKILIIDDQRDNLTSIRAVIVSKMPATDVIVSRSGKEGLLLARSKQPDTILLDIYMPNMDGYQTCQELKKDPITRHIPIVMLTAVKSDSSTRARALEMGADAFISKPIDPIELTAQIKVMLRIKKAEDDLRHEKNDLELKVEQRTKELYQNKEKLNQIISGYSIATLIINENQEIIHWNKACEKLTGIKSEDIIGSKKYSEVFYKKNRPILADIVFNDSPIELLEKYYKDKYQKSSLLENVFEIEDFFPNFGDNGTWLYFTAVPLFDKAGKKIGAIETLQDITDEKNIDKKLRESEDKYRNLVERANDGICILQDGKVKYANSCLLNIWGGTIENVIGKSFTDFIHPDHIFNLVSYYKKRITGQNITSIYDTVLINTSGKEVYTELSAGIITYEGKPADLVIIRDKSDRKKSEKEIRKLSTAIRQSPSTIVITDLKGIIEYVNPKFIELTGYTIDESIGNNASILKSGFQTKEFYSNLWSTIKSGKTWRGEFYNTSKLGEHFCESASISPIIDNEGKITNYIKVAEDITDKKRTDQLQLVLYKISNAALSTNTLEELISIVRNELGTIIDTKNFFIAFYDKETDTFSSPFMSDEKDDFNTWPAGKTFSAYVMKNSEPLFVKENDILKMAEMGKVEVVGAIPKAGIIVPLISEGKTIGVFAVQNYTNINAYTEKDLEMLEFVSGQISVAIHRKKTVEELIFALQKANESDMLKTAFLQNISHEIRTPMNGIFGFASLLKDPTLTGAEQQAYIDVIMTSGNRMLNTLNDLMDISMIDTGQVKIKQIAVNINEELRNLYAFFINETNNLNLSLEYSILLPDHEAQVISDKEKLYAILSNLIKNAIKYSNSGTIRFGYKIDNNNIVFFVKDDGIGIPEEKMEAIFNRFEQADLEDVKVHEGSGLGLSISKGYVNLLGGDIWVESNVGKGSQFYFSIPYNAKNIDTSVENKTDNLGKSTLHNKKLKILIAEDEIIASEYLSIILSDICPEPLFAKNGVEAIEIFKQNPDIDIILMDIKMPLLNGYQTTKKIRETNKDIIIIAQTAYALAGDKEKAISAGCNEYITKPIDKDKLYSLINELI